MKFQLVNLISFLLLLNNQLVASANEEYYSKSILKELKEKKGHIVTDLELVDPNEKTVNHVEEKYSFLFNSGEYVGQEKSGKLLIFLKFLKFSSKFSSKFNKHLINWSISQTFRRREGCKKRRTTHF